MVIQPFFLKKIKLIDLLPYSKEMVIHSNNEAIAIVDLLCFFLDKLKNSIECFYFFQNFNQFDAQVGENSCQIRACQLLYLYRRNYRNSLSSENQAILGIRKIKEIKEALESIKTSYMALQRIGKRFKKCTLFDLIKINEAVMELKGEFSILFLYHFLTHFSKRDQEGILICIDYEKTCLEMGISKTLARRIIHHFQKLASGFSSIFIIYLIKTIKAVSHLNPAIKPLLKRDEENRFILPCYFLSQAIWHYLQETKGDILLVVDKKTGAFTTERFFLLFKPNSLGKFDFLAEINESNVTADPVFIIRGSFLCETESEAKEVFIKNVQKEGLESVILTNQAAHPQYAGKKLEIFKNDPFSGAYISDAQEYQDLIDFFNDGEDVLDSSNFKESMFGELAIELSLMRTQAGILGCCKENNSLFLITHVLFDKIDSIFDSWGACGIYLKESFESEVL